MPTRCHVHAKAQCSRSPRRTAQVSGRHRYWRSQTSRNNCPMSRLNVRSESSCVIRPFASTLGLVPGARHKQSHFFVTPLPLFFTVLAAAFRRLQVNAPIGQSESGRPRLVTWHCARAGPSTDPEVARGPAIFTKFPNPSGQCRLRAARSRQPSVEIRFHECSFAFPFADRQSACDHRGTAAAALGADSA